MTLGGAALAGMVAHALLRDADIGVGWLLLDILLVAAMLLLLPAPGRRPSRAAWVFAAAAIWLGGATVYYASEWATMIALPGSIAALAMLAVVTSRTMTFRHLGTLGRAWLDVLHASPAAIASSGRLPAEALDAGGRRHLFGIVRGLLLGIPVAAVFALLLSAEPNFRAAVTHLIGGSGEGASFILCSLAMGALLLLVHQTMSKARERAEMPSTLEARAEEGPYRGLDLEPKRVVIRLPRVRTLTWAVVLLQLVAVFAVYALANRAYLFGGDALVTARGTPTYAQYLHQGFAQVTIASLLAVVAVVSGHALLRVPAAACAEPIPGGRALAALESVLLGLASLALVSCWHRLRIYEMAYGHTHLRLAVGFFQLGVAGVLAVTVAKSVARGWRGYGAALVLTLVAWVVVAASVNADARIASGNIERARTGRPLDVDYLCSLSPDARAVAVDPAISAVWNGRARELHGRGWRAWRGIAGW